MKFEKLGNIADIIAGQSPPSSTYNSEGNGIPFFQGKADYGEKYPSVRYWCTEPTKISLPDDILISMRAPVGPVNINTIESCIGRGLSAIRVKKNVSRDFIYFWLKQNQHIIAAKQTGSTFKAITQKILSEIVVPFPSYSDQLQIASILSKAENLIAQRKESIRLLDEFLKSTFLEMFGDPVRNERGWEIVGIETACSDIFLGLTNKVDYVEEGGFPLIRTTDIKGGKLSFENVRYISEAQHRKITKNRISKRGDILVSKSGTLGTTAIVDTDIEFTTYESIITIQPNPVKLVNHYLNFLLKNTNFQIKMLGGKTGGTVGHLNLLMFREITLPLPPLELQTQFAQIVEKTEALKSQYQQSLQELENLYGSLSQKAFRGELLSEL